MVQEELHHSFRDSLTVAFGARTSWKLELFSLSADCLAVVSAGTSSIGIVGAETNEWEFFMLLGWRRPYTFFWRWKNFSRGKGGGSGGSNSSREFLWTHQIPSQLALLLSVVSIKIGSKLLGGRSAT
mmetsp:Transcript_8289/g.12057  ORF Transcript_8289/g.12057 Transcript_8289/m.12057 type:complete len:127 (+) Transcript_8289:247-627(+)